MICKVFPNLDDSVSCLLCSVRRDWHHHALAQAVVSQRNGSRGGRRFRMTSSTADGSSLRLPPGDVPASPRWRRPGAPERGELTAARGHGGHRLPMALSSRSWLVLAAARLQARGAGLRLASTTVSLKTETEVDTSENEVVAPDFTNRNPRNLEQLALARKERGWKTTWPKREFWHRLRLERTQHYVEAFVERSNGDVVVSASTREWAIKRHLYSPKGVTACKNLGRVMARRCLEAGINFVNFKAIIPWEYRCDSIQEFKKAVEEGGVVLCEPRRIYQ
ncbi:large ribosomal subunit protein uL18m [Strix uralensis]|uniref:large ribosomal subunit protein uL18m n=1 Tax=Strix uralensis TaxID=36305 RepID=UPI003DA7015D